MCLGGYFCEDVEDYSSQRDNADDDFNHTHHPTPPTGGLKFDRPVVKTFGTMEKLYQIIFTLQIYFKNACKKVCVKV